MPKLTSGGMFADARSRLKDRVIDTPVLGGLARLAWRGLGRILEPLAHRGFDASRYWDERYAAGGTSGAGSYGRLAEYKAEFLNDFVRDNAIQSVIEFGCGDGHQLSLMRYPRYLGLDVSEAVIRRCEDKFRDDATKRFLVYDSLTFSRGATTAELAVSLDVLFHIVDDSVFDTYLRDLFASATRYVVIYADDTGANPAWRASHIKHRRFTPWVARHQPSWRLLERVPNKYPFVGDYRSGSHCDFFIYACS